MTTWEIDRVVDFAPGDLVKDGFVHFGFHDLSGRQFLVEHQRHFVGLVGEGDQLEWTAAAGPVVDGVPNIRAALNAPMFVDSLPDGSLVVSTLGDASLWRIDPQLMTAEVLVDGHALGLVDMGNGVVDEEGTIWVNEVTGCRVWRFDGWGRALERLGKGRPGPAVDGASFEEVRFHWIYDLRRGPDGRLYVLDSRNFVLRAIDPLARRVVTIAGGRGRGYEGDGGDARQATFGSDPTAQFDGPISLSLDGDGNAYVGDRYNHVVRMVERESGVISTIVGSAVADPDRRNDHHERDPRRVNLPAISSMDLHGDRLFVPTDLSGDRGDLIVLRRQPRVG